MRKYRIGVHFIVFLTWLHEQIDWNRMGRCSNFRLSIKMHHLNYHHMQINLVDLNYRMNTAKIACFVALKPHHDVKKKEVIACNSMGLHPTISQQRLHQILRIKVIRAIFFFLISYRKQMIPNGLVWTTRIASIQWIVWVNIYSFFLSTTLKYAFCTDWDLYFSWIELVIKLNQLSKWLMHVCVYFYYSWNKCLRNQCLCSQFQAIKSDLFWNETKENLNFQLCIW